MISLLLLTFVLLLLFLTTAAAFGLFHRYFTYRRQVETIAGPPVGSLLLGHLGLFLKPPRMHIRQFLVKMYSLLLSLCEQYRREGAFRLWFGPLYSIFILTNAESVERLLSSPVNLNKGHEYRFLAPWLGDGLLLADAKVWRTRRKLLTPAFHFKILENFIPIFSRHTDLLLAKIDAAISPETGTASIEDIRPLVEDLTLDIVNETSMGMDHEEVGCNSQSNNESYRVSMKRAFRRAVHRFSNPLYWLDFIYKRTEQGQKFYHNVTGMMSYVDRIIDKKMSEYREKLKAAESTDQNNNNNNTDIDSGKTSRRETIFLDILLEKYFSEPNSISPANMRSEVNTFILGGHDTTANATIFALLLVGQHPEVAEKIVEELEEAGLLPQKDLQKEGQKGFPPIEMEALKRLRYLEATIKETLRLYPSVQVIARRLVEALVLPDGKQIAAGSTVYVPILSLHLDEAVFPQPNSFIPERFLPSSSSASSTVADFTKEESKSCCSFTVVGQATKNPYAFIPFSAGARSCIGQKYAMLELKFVLASIFRRYRVTSHTRPAEIIKELMPVIKPLNSIRVDFQLLQRQHSSSSSPLPTTRAE